MMYKVEHISANASHNSGYWQVTRKGKVVKTFFGVTAKDDANDYARDCVEADRLYAHFYAE